MHQRAVSPFLEPGSTINSAKDKGLTVGNLVSGSISVINAPEPPLQTPCICSSRITSQRCLLCKSRKTASAKRAERIEASSPAVGVTSNFNSR